MLRRDKSDKSPRDERDKADKLERDYRDKSDKQRLDKAKEKKLTPGQGQQDEDSHDSVASQPTDDRNSHSPVSSKKRSRAAEDQGSTSNVNSALSPRQILSSPLNKRANELNGNRGEKQDVHHVTSHPADKSIKSPRKAPPQPDVHGNGKDGTDSPVKGKKKVSPLDKPQTGYSL